MSMAGVVSAGLKKMVSHKTLSNMKDYHIPVLLFMFVCGGILEWFGHLTMAFVAYTGTIVAGVTGQAFSPAQKGNGDVNSNSTNTSDPSGGSK